MKDPKEMTDNELLETLGLGETTEVDPETGDVYTLTTCSPGLTRSEAERLIEAIANENDRGSLD